jgi:PAS domain S-box-containing protein
MPDNLVNISGSKLLAGGVFEAYRQQVARITPDAPLRFACLLDTEGTVLHVNLSALDRAGGTHSEMLGKPFWTSFWPQASDAVRATLEDAVLRAARGETLRCDLEMPIRADGAEIAAIDISLTPIDNEGAIAFIVAEARDTTAIRRLERENTRLRAELEALKAELDPEEIIVSPAVPKGTYVLLADDDPAVRAQASRLLGRYCEIGTFADGEAALQAIRQRRPDLVLADSAMPGFDGLALLGAIRAEPALRDIPVIMLAAQMGEEPQMQGLDVGADDYLSKPFSARELVARVGVNLQLARIRHEAMAGLRESEERFRAFVTASSDVVYRMSPDWLEMRHLEGKDFIPTTQEPSQTWLTKYIHPEDQPEVLAAIDKAIRTKSIFELEHRVMQVDGTRGWTFSRAIPLLDENGELIEWFGAASDVTQRKRHEQHQRMLLDELNHRVKNTLVTVQSMARQTLRNATSVAESRDVFDARLIALSKAHNVLTREHWEGAGLKEIVGEALAAYSTNALERRIRFEGPELRLQPKAALALSMALHELATNAVKYGALSNTTGEVAIDWRTEDNSDYFHLRWTESGGPSVAIPLRRGFGSRLIEQGLSQDLAGDVKLEFRPEGVVCTIAAPLDELLVGSEEQPLQGVMNLNGLGA